MSRTIGVYDEGITLVGADRVLHGAIPHRDFYALYGPGQFFAVAGLFKLFGASVLVERAWTVFGSACSVVLIFFVVNRIAPKAFALAGAIAALLWFQINSSYGSATVSCTALMLAGLLFLVPAMDQAGAAPRLAGAGACAGMVMLFRYDVGVAVLVAECMLLTLSTWFRRSPVADRPRSIVLRLAVFCAGFAVVALPVGAAYAAGGVLHDLYFDVVAFPSEAYVRTRGLPLPRSWMLRKNPAEFIGVYLPLIMSVAAVPAIVAAVRSRQNILRWTLLALVTLELLWFSKGFVRASVVQMAMALVFCAPLAAVLGQPIRPRGRFGGVVAALALLIGLGETIAKQPQALAAMRQNIEQPPDCHPAAGLERARCFDLSPDTVQTIQFVQQATRPDDPIFVGLYRHDRIFINDVTLYFLLDRPPATMWYHFDPGLQTSAAIQQKMIGEMQRVRPKLIVLTRTEWDNEREPNDSALSSGVTSLDDFIRQGYQPVATFGATTVLRLKPP